MAYECCLMMMMIVIVIQCLYVYRMHVCVFLYDHNRLLVRLLFFCFINDQIGNKKIHSIHVVIGQIFICPRFSQIFLMAFVSLFFSVVLFLVVSNNHLIHCKQEKKIIKNSQKI